MNHIISSVAYLAIVSNNSSFLINCRTFYFSQTRKKEIMHWRNNTKQKSFYFYFLDRKKKRIVHSVISFICFPRLSAAAASRLIKLCSRECRHSSFSIWFIRASRMFCFENQICFLVLFGCCCCCWHIIRNRLRRHLYGSRRWRRGGNRHRRHLLHQQRKCRKPPRPWCLLRSFGALA